jgi:hypothetical protein
MKASGKTGSNEVLVSDNEEKRFQTDIYQGYKESIQPF